MSLNRLLQKSRRKAMRATTVHNSVKTIKMLVSSTEGTNGEVLTKEAIIRD